MNNLVFIKHWQKIILNEPIEVYSLRLHPIYMRDYTIVQACRSALELRLGALPAIYARCDYASALYALDIDEIERNDKALGYLGMFATMLCLSLQMPIDHIHDIIQFECEPTNPRILTGIKIRQNENKITLRPVQIGKIRQIIAFQNGIELPDEADNPELIEAINLKMRLEMPILNTNPFDLIAAVAYKSNVREQEIMSWTIREFEARWRAINRDIQHLICGIGECNGTTWKNGNPAPSWCFDRKTPLNGGFVSEETMIGQLSQVGNIRNGN